MVIIIGFLMLSITEKSVKKTSLESLDHREGCRFRLSAKASPVVQGDAPTPKQSATRAPCQGEALN